MAKAFVLFTFRCMRIRRPVLKLHSTNFSSKFKRSSVQHTALLERGSLRQPHRQENFNLSTLQRHDTTTWLEPSWSARSPYQASNMVQKATNIYWKGTLGSVCGDLGLGDARPLTWGHQAWDAGTCGTGTPDVKYRDAGPSNTGTRGM